MTAEEIELLSESDSDRRKRLWFKTSFAVAIVGWLIIGSTLNTIIFNSFPLKLATPEWQLSLIAALLSSGYAFLVGAVLIALALLFNPKEQVFQKWQRTVSRLSGFFVILLVLIIPLQFFLGSRALNSQTISAFEAINSLKGVAKRISAVNSEPELRSYVASLPNPPALPAKFDAAFPVIKQRAIENISAQINAATYNSEIQKSQALQVFLKEGIRNTAQAILMAVAFSAMANLSGKAGNAVTKFFDSLR
jgi:cytochrome b561